MKWLRNAKLKWMPSILALPPSQMNVIPFSLSNSLSQLFRWLSDHGWFQFRGWRRRWSRIRSSWVWRCMASTSTKRKRIHIRSVCESSCAHQYYVWQVKTAWSRPLFVRTWCLLLMLSCWCLGRREDGRQRALTWLVLTRSTSFQRREKSSQRFILPIISAFGNPSPPPFPWHLFYSFSTSFLKECLFKLRIYLCRAGPHSFPHWWTTIHCL